MPNAAAGYDPVVGVLTVAVLLALLAMSLRRLQRSLRAFLPSSRPPRAGRAGAADYGLLVPVATVPTAADAQMLREVLAGYGIRATVAPARDAAGVEVAHRATMCVLVFPDDAARAKDVLATR